MVSASRRCGWDATVCSSRVARYVVWIDAWHGRQI